MFSRKSRADQAADHFADSAHGAVHTSADLLDEAIDKISPLVSAAADKATELVSHVAPIADQARDVAAQNLSQAGERIAPLAASAKDAAKDRLAPTASQARDVLAPAAAAAAAAKIQITPHVQALLDAAQPKLDEAKSRAQEDLVPRLTQLLQQISDEHPAVADYSNRSQAALQALRGETTKYVAPEIDDPESSKLKTVAKLAAVGAVLAAITVAVRQFLASKDDGWTAHQPSTAYTTKPADTTKPTDKATEAKPEPVVVKDEAPITYTTVTETKDADTKDADAKDADKPATDEQAAAPLVATSAAEAEEVMVDEGGPVADGGVAASPVLDDVNTNDQDAESAPVVDSTESAPVATDAEEDSDEEATLANAEPQYGEGWYMGDNPPADYLIKGNERSMKYHVPGSGGYDRTIADVWFNSEEAAQQAGFTRAQR